MTGTVAINNRSRCRLPLKLLNRIVGDFLLDYRLKRQSVSLAFVGDSVMRRLNRDTRGLNKVTDVLSWRDSEAAIPDKNFLGEIVIDCQQIKRQAARAKRAWRQELIFILTHGLLHLAGYLDETEAQADKMDLLTKKFLAKHHYD